MLSADETGSITAAEGLSHVQGVLSARGLKISRLIGSIDGTEATISKATLSNVKIEDSDIVLPQAVSFGSLVVRSQQVRMLTVFVGNFSVFTNASVIEQLVLVVLIIVSISILRFVTDTLSFLCYLDL